MQKYARFKSFSIKRLPSMAGSFWLRRFHLLFFLIYVPAIMAVCGYFWQRALHRQSWTAEQKKQYLVENGQFNRDFSEAKFRRVVEDLAASRKNFSESPKDIKDIFAPIK